MSTLFELEVHTPVANVVHCKREQYDIYIGRPAHGLPGSIWANPFVIGYDGTREEVIAKYRQYVLGKPELLAQLESLRGQVLGCWCSPQACHGDVLVELLSGKRERGMSDTIPQYVNLFEDYKKKLDTLKYRVMFVVLDNAHYIDQFTRSESLWWIGTMLRSGHNGSVRCAVEAMSRTLDRWE